MARKKHTTATSKRGPSVAKGPIIESYIMTEDGRKKAISHSRVQADMVLGRLKRTRAVVTVYFDGEYTGAIMYEAK